jgi:hypothetical protein
MNSIYAWISQGREQVEEQAFDGTEQWLTFVPETTQSWRSPDGKLAMRCWSVCDEAARGGWSVTSKTTALTLAGWFREPDEGPLTTTMAAAAAAQLARGGIEGFAELPGNYSLAWVSEDGSLRAFTDPWCSEHLFYGHRGDRAVISNRAAVVAALLFTEVPSPRPEALGWLLSGADVPVEDDDSAWSGVKLLRGGRALRVRGPIIEEHETDCEEQHPPLASYAQVFERLCWTAGWIRRLPGVELELAITGGFDSRLVLAGLVGANVASAITRCYLKGHDGHQDVLVGKAIATHYGLDFELRPVDHVDDDFFSVARRHIFQTELLVNAWDLKGADEQTRVVRLHGNLGELYKGHGLPLLSTNWPALRAYLRSDHYLDRYGVLSRGSLEFQRERIDAFISRERREGCKPNELLDHYHRRVRVARWVGQVMQYDSAAGPNVHILPDPVIHRFYRHLPYEQRQQSCIHFELTRAADDWLWRQPFAGKTWPRARQRGAATSCVRSTASASVPRQLLMWRNNEKRLRDFLLAPTTSRLFEIVDRQRLTRLLAEVGERPTNRQLRALLATATVRIALESPLEPRPVRVRPHPEV